jgi:hypothetical protein
VLAKTIGTVGVLVLTGLNLLGSVPGGVTGERPGGSWRDVGVWGAVGGVTLAALWLA